jgi:hypothetical protein
MALEETLVLAVYISEAAVALLVMVAQAQT